MSHGNLGRKQTKEHIANRVARFKEVIALKPLPLKDMRERLLSKIKKDKNGCWTWTGYRLRKKYGDYGLIHIGRLPNKKIKRAHRVSYEFFVGPIPEGLEIDHLCHNTLCINPDHLEPVTHAENMKRRKDSGLPYCRHGHKYTPETTYYRPDNGRRECKVCKHRPRC